MCLLANQRGIAESAQSRVARLFRRQSAFPLFFFFEFQIGLSSRSRSAFRLLLCHHFMSAFLCLRSVPSADQAIALFNSQCLHRIDARRPPRRNQAG
jgi:hypothetical protein